MMTDYKFWYIKRDDNGFIVECAIRFFEGDITTEQEKDFNGVLKNVTRYRRLKKMGKSDLPHLADKKFIKETNNTEAVLYNQEDFGSIKTDDELRLFLNKELARDVVRQPIPEQK